MKGKASITFEGLNVNRFVNNLNRHTVIYSVKRDGKVCSITVPSSSLDHTVALLKEKCYNISKIEYLGAAACSQFVKRRFVIVAICVLAVLSVFALSNVCLEINVTGDFPSETVMEALAELSVKRGTSLVGFSADKLENALANKLDAMYAVVSRKGSVLYVNVVERKITQPPIDLNKRRDLTADVSGKVTKIICEQGTPVVKAGDTVKIGDVLILGERRFNDGESEDVYALGKVFIELTSVGFCEYNGTKTEYVRTGQTRQFTKVVLFGNEYGGKCPFDRFEQSCASVFLQPFNLEIRRYTYFETARQTVSATIDECMEELKAAALKSARENCGFEVTETEFKVSSNGVTAVLYGEAEIN